MKKYIVILQGHPDADKSHLGHALAGAYARAAQAAGNEVDTIFVADLDFPVLRTKSDFEKGVVPEHIKESQQLIKKADHIVIFYPLWLGTMPALLKAFIEQVFRPGFAFAEVEESRMPEKLLKGKSARIVITMGMPVFIYRWYYGAHSLKSLERNVLKFAGIGPISETLIGMVESGNKKKMQKCFKKMTQLGSKAI